jgi:hypothetical protein
VTTNGQKLALIPMTDRIDAAEQLLICETSAAKTLMTSIKGFRKQIAIISSERERFSA